MIAARRSNASTEKACLLSVACGLAMVMACSNQITYSRISDILPDGGAGAGGATLPGSGGSGGSGAAGAGDGGSGAGGTGAGGLGTGGTGGADAGTDTPVGSGGMIGTGGAGTGGAGMGGTGTGGAGIGGTGTGGAGMGGTGTGGAGMGGMGTGGAIVDNAQFNFEASAQGWAALGPWTGTGRMTAQHFAGLASLGATLTYTPAASGVTQELWITPAAGTGPVAGDLVTFHVFLPANASGVVAWVQPYIQDGAASQAFINAYTPAAMLTFGGWNTITLPLPATTVSPVFKIAVQLFTSGTVAFTGNIYVDSIGW